MGNGDSADSTVMSKQEIVKAAIIAIPEDDVCWLWQDVGREMGTSRGFARRGSLAASPADQIPQSGLILLPLRSVAILFLPLPRYTHYYAEHPQHY